MRLLPGSSEIPLWKFCPVPRTSYVLNKCYLPLLITMIISALLGQPRWALSREDPPFAEAAPFLLCSQATLARLLRCRPAPGASSSPLPLLGHFPGPGSVPPSLWHLTLFLPQPSFRLAPISPPFPFPLVPLLVRFLPLPISSFWLLFLVYLFLSRGLWGKPVSFLRDPPTLLCRVVASQPLQLHSAVGSWPGGQIVHPEGGGHDLAPQPRTLATLTNPDSHNAHLQPWEPAGRTATPGAAEGGPCCQGEGAGTHGEPTVWGPQSPNRGWRFQSQQILLGSKDTQKEKAGDNPRFLEPENQPHLESLSFWEVKEFVSRGCFSFIPLKRTWSSSTSFPGTGARLWRIVFPLCLDRTRFFPGHLSSTCCMLSLCLELRMIKVLMSSSGSSQVGD